MNHTSNGIAAPRFTGERVIPGKVDVDLWNEHVARYEFAAGLSANRVVLDLGCGAGYGAEVLCHNARSVTGLDSSDEIATFASGAFPQAKFLTASATELPFRSRSFNLVVAFELIEHVAEWPRVLAEAARVLTPDGIFIVSTPNKPVYAEQRGNAGPNPFHEHEFEEDEFRQALGEVFSSVVILAQNHQAAIVFADSATRAPNAYLPANSLPSDSQFFVAVCSASPVRIPSFVFVPASANLVYERERHIRKLEEQLGESQGQFGALLDKHRKLDEELREHNEWALRLEGKLNENGRALRQKEADLSSALNSLESGLVLLKDSETKREATDKELASFKKQVSQHKREAAQAAERLRRVKAELEQASDARWQAAQAQIDRLSAELGSVKSSSWIRLGRLLHIGPYSVRSVRLSSPKRTVLQAANFVRRMTGGVCGTILLALTALSLWAVDLAFALFGRKRLAADTAAEGEKVSVVIPSWNGREMLERSLPPLIDAVDFAGGDEVIVVDNGSTDDSIEFLQQHFPQIRVLPLLRNLGFAAGANAGVAAARGEVVLLLNNDMKVDREFLKPLREHFLDPLVFAVSSQIFFADTQRRREETGLTETWWENGRHRVSHRIDADLQVAYPCAYPGGGSSAFHRAKFLQLGGFDALFDPFYYEDTDLGHLAWKRGWKVLYEPRSRVIHEHRGTIGKHFSTTYINNVVRRNAILFCWKNIHDWRLLLAHFANSVGDCFRQSSANDGADAFSRRDAFLAVRAVRKACRSRWRALSVKVVSDREAFLRPAGGYFRDRFLVSSSPAPERLNVLFASPYPIQPPVHGGAVFMRETLSALSELADVHLVSFLDVPEQLAANRTLSAICKTVQLLVRPHFPIDKFWTLTPAAIREFRVREFAWLIHRTIFLEQIDVIQLEYTILGQYGGHFKNIPCLLFEHDISLQSLRRRLHPSKPDVDLLLEYARMRHYEPRLLRRFDGVQVCSEENARYLLRIVPALKDKIDWRARAAIEVDRYQFAPAGRQPDSLLFIGSFRHGPNLEGLSWFTHNVLPRILAVRPGVFLYIVGFGAPEASTVWNDHPRVRLLGSVLDIQECLRKYQVFICPILSGSGVRVKLLEAFAMGIPAVSTALGAEGLSRISGDCCETADSPEDFAASVLRLLADEDYRLDLATRARTMVERERNSLSATRNLEAGYRREVEKRRKESTFQ